MEEDDEFRSRGYDPIHHEQYVRILLDRLAASAQKTDPCRQAPAEGKDHEAFSALLRANELVGAVAGWALDHVSGLSSSGQKMLPRQPNGSKSHPEYLKSRMLADTHDHELNGSQTFRSRPPSMEARRLILRNLIFAGAGGLPHWLREDLLEALDALDAGSTTPLLEPAPRRNGPGYFKLQAKLRLVAFVAFRCLAFSTSKEKARAFIGQGDRVKKCVTMG